MKYALIRAYLWLLSPIIDLFRWKRTEGIRYSTWIALMTHAYGFGDKIRGPRKMKERGQ